MHRKIFFTVIAVLTLASCQKEPDLNELDNEYLVYTRHDESFSIGKHHTYCIPDSILIVNYSGEEEYMTNSISDAIIAEYVANMEDFGYTRVYDKTTADLGIQLSYISDTTYFTDYVSSSYWWWGYPGYWDPFYWGGWGGWGYTYPVTYTYSVNSLLTEMLDLKSEEGQDKNLPVIWNAYICGAMSGSSKFDTKLMLLGIDRAFGQSQYLNINIK